MASFLRNSIVAEPVPQHRDNQQVLSGFRLPAEGKVIEGCTARIVPNANALLELARVLVRFDLVSRFIITRITARRAAAKPRSQRAGGGTEALRCVSAVLLKEKRESVIVVRPPAPLKSAIVVRQLRFLFLTALKNRPFPVPASNLVALISPSFFPTR
jgi:hypothetical protein